MNKKLDLGIILASLVFILLAHKPLALGMMHIVDSIGYMTNSNVVEIIDFLNNIYYL